MTEATPPSDKRVFNTNGLTPRTIQDSGAAGAEKRIFLISRHPERLPDELYEELLELSRQGEVQTTAQMRAWFRATFDNADQLRVAHGLADNFRNLVAGTGRSRAITQGNRKVMLEKQTARRQEEEKRRQAAEQARAVAEAEIREDFGEEVVERYPEIIPLLLDGRVPRLSNADASREVHVYEWLRGLCRATYAADHCASDPGLLAQYLNQMAEKILHSGHSTVEAFTYLRALTLCGTDPEHEDTLRKRIESYNQSSHRSDELFYLESLYRMNEQDAD